MNALRRNEITEAQIRFIRAQENEVLAALVRYLPGHSKKPLLLNGITDLPSDWNSSCIEYTMKFRLEKAKKTQFPCGNFEEIHVQKGRVEYRHDTVTLVLPSTELIVVTSESIPLPTEVPDRQGLQAVAHILGAIFEVDKGELKQYVDLATLEAKFGGVSGLINVPKIAQVHSVFLSILEDSFEWREVTNPTSKNQTKKGRDFYSFMLTILQKCSRQNYWALHTVIAYDLFNLVYYDEKSGKLNNVTYLNGTKRENRLLPGSLVKVPSNKATKKEFDEFLSATRRVPVILTGPFRTRHLGIGSREPSLRVALMAAGSGVSFRGGSSRGQGLIVDGIGFSGLPSDQTKRRLRILSVAYPAMLLGDIQIKCHQNDVASLIYSFKKLDKASENSTIGRYRFVLSNEDYFKIDRKYSPYVSTSGDNGVLTIFVSESTPPSLDSKSDPSEVFKGHYRDFIKSIGAGRFIAYAPIYHEEFFKSNVFKERRFSTDFAAYITSENKISSCTIDYAGDGMIYSQRELTRIKTPEDMWKYVIDSNNAANSWFLGPHTDNFFPISNILAGDVPKHAFAETEGEKETGSLAMDYGDYLEESDGAPIGMDRGDIGAPVEPPTFAAAAKKAKAPPEAIKEKPPKHVPNVLEKINQKNEAAAAKYKAKVPQATEASQPMPPPQIESLQVDEKVEESVLPPEEAKQQEIPPPQISAPAIEMAEEGEDENEDYNENPPPPKVPEGAGKEQATYMENTDMVDNEL